MPDSLELMDNKVRLGQQDLKAALVLQDLQGLQALWVYRVRMVNQDHREAKVQQDSLVP